MRRALVAAITLVSTATLVSSATLTAAYASQHGASQRGASQDRRVSQDRARQDQASHISRVRHERFRIISTSATSRRQSALATGEFTAGGYVVPGQVTGLRSTDKMVFPSGTFLVARHITRQSLPLPTSACLISETIHGTYSLSHGTKAFAGISGSGGFVLRITGVIRKSHGKCGGSMTVYQQITYESGTVRR
jgi:hypothetical protein